MIRSRFNPTLLDNRISDELETGNDNGFKCIFSYFANFLILQLLMNQWISVTYVHVLQHRVRTKSLGLGGKGVGIFEN